MRDALLTAVESSGVRVLWGSQAEEVLVETGLTLTLTLT